MVTRVDLGGRYGFNNYEAVARSEALMALGDYFSGRITGEDKIEGIVLCFSNRLNRAFVLQSPLPRPGW